MKAPTSLITLFLAFCLVGVTISPSGILAHSLNNETLPDMGVDEKLGAPIPLDLTFTDQDGRKVRLRDYLTGGPVVLTLNYYSCPTLCPLVLRNFSNTISGIRGLSLATDYSIITVSIDPEETLERTRAKAEETWRMVKGDGLPAGRWPFLFGGEEAIKSLSGSVGFRYSRVGKNNFAHPTIFVVITPAGRVARYLYGIDIPPAELKLALMEAAGGKIGGSPFLNQVILYCYHYDPVGKRYGLAAVNIMKIAGGGILLFLGAMLFVLWRSEKRCKKRDGNVPEEVNR